MTINSGLGDDIFTFVVPDGVEVVQAADVMAEHAVTLPDDFVALAPAELPDGAVALDAGERGGWHVQRFDLPDGGSFTVAQGLDSPPDPPADSSQEKVTVRGQEGVVYSNEAGDRTLLMWGEGDKIFFIGGDVTPAQALAVAESLQ